MNLVARHVNKKIKNCIILHDVNLELEKGKIYAFVGENGSGKSMLLRALSGMMKIDCGEVIYNNKVIHKDIVSLPSVGIVMENIGLYPNLSSFKNLSVLSKINKTIGKKEIMESIKRVGLDPIDQLPFDKFSLGMKQRLIIAQAIMERPEVIMLDEPTNTLDDQGVSLIRQIILEEKARGALILITSHISEDIRLLADQFFTVNNGCIENGV